ncbi:hypothetical protein P389DRAFT_71490 [Cystobasidium minutum MCA 4210]|uniref:uncharacterized protein n=1 Tax=Cystobasidium minutum MCA 4210 TaxID=1397322 RepID=UPI0034CF1ACF|eukprot:jgi/Rhomi1/71490/CE71489_39
MVMSLRRLSLPLVFTPVHPLDLHGISDPPRPSNKWLHLDEPTILPTMSNNSRTGASASQNGHPQIHAAPALTSTASQNGTDRRPAYAKLGSYTDLYNSKNKGIKPITEQGVRPNTQKVQDGSGRGNGSGSSRGGHPSQSSSRPDQTNNSR